MSISLAQLIVPHAIQSSRPIATEQNYLGSRRHYLDGQSNPDTPIRKKSPRLVRHTSSARSSWLCVIRYSYVGCKMSNHYRILTNTVTKAPRVGPVPLNRPLFWTSIGCCLHMTRMTASPTPLGGQPYECCISDRAIVRVNRKLGYNMQQASPLIVDSLPWYQVYPASPQTIPRSSEL
jgi:hypothetical protein